MKSELGWGLVVPILDLTRRRSVDLVKLRRRSTPVKVKEDETPARFVGAQIPGAEARKKWPHRYANKVTFYSFFYQ
jgi:hypothetical protein